MTEPDPPHIKIESVGGQSPIVYTAIGVVSLLLVLAILKPWSSGTPSPTPGRPVAAVQRSPDVTLSASIAPTTPADKAIAAARARMLCGSVIEWRLLTMETGSLGTSRTVYHDAPARAAGPTDLAIPTIDVTASRLLGIGVCRPSLLDRDDGPVLVSAVTIWRIDALGAPAIVPGTTTIDSDLSRVGEAYFRPNDSEPSNTTGATPAWDPGRYVIQIDHATSDDAALWFALDFSTMRASTGTVIGW